jgi:hypothetical protein
MMAREDLRSKRRCGIPLHLFDIINLDYLRAAGELIMENPDLISSQMGDKN